MSGRLVVFEGIDGSGKSTQLELLCKRLEEEGREYKRIVFPRYSNPSSALIRMYLGGEFGSKPEDVGAYAASTFFAVDRYASFVQDWREDYEAGRLIVSDRYTTSNAIHQASKLCGAEREEFLTWLYDFEFRLLGLPKPDEVIYMDIPLEVSLANMAKRNGAGDIHENNKAYLASCLECAKQAAEHYGWRAVSCAQGGQMRPAQEISDEIWNIIFGA